MLYDKYMIHQWMITFYTKVCEKSIENVYWLGICDDKGVKIMKEKTSNTFIVKVLNQQNDSWQGSVTWADTNETQYFRSALELLHMMNDVVNPEAGIQ